jgi:hypothetical protein
MVYQQDNRAFASSYSFCFTVFHFFSYVAPAVSPAVMKTVEDLNSSH